MPLATKEIKRRLRSIGNTKKITKAMELVSAAKMRKAVNSVLQTRAYSNAAWQIIKNLSSRTDPSQHPLLLKRDQIKKIGVVLITSNRGLCGGFNREIIETLARYLKGNEVSAQVSLVGKRGRDIMHRYSHQVIAEFDKSDVAESVTEVTALAKLVINDYLSGKYDKVVIAYTDFESAISQEPRIRKLLPIDKQDDELGQISDGNRGDVKDKNISQDYEYIFEPSADVVLDQMLYRLIELQIYQALLESNASEHSARMMAMRNASDASSDMIDDLTLSFNQARQQAITSEIAEISAGSAAVN